MNYVWEDEVLNIDCPDNHHISIVHAHYGFGICNFAGSLEALQNRYISKNWTSTMNRCHLTSYYETWQIYLSFAIPLDAKKDSHVG